MAKKKKSTGLAKTRTRTVVVRSVGGAGKATAAAAMAEKHTLTAIGSAAVLGYAQRENMLDTVPHIEALGVEGTLGVVAFIGGKYMKSKVLSHVATGLMSVAAWKLANGTAT